MQTTVSHLGVLFNTDFHALAIELGIPVRHVSFISGILSDSEGVFMLDAALLASNISVASCVNYCNSLFRSTSVLNRHRLQCVQNSLNRTVANTTKYSHVTSVTKTPHWLPIKHRSSISPNYALALFYDFSKIISDLHQFTFSPNPIQLKHILKRF